MVGASGSDAGAISGSGNQRLPTLTDLLYQLATRAVTSEELVRRSLRAIDVSQPTLNAFRVVLTAMLRQARRHRKRHGDNLFASLLAREVADGSRIVVRGELFTAFVPFAARWPVEVHIYPNRLVRNLTELNDGELDEFARIYLDVLQRFDRMYSSPLPYMSALHQFSEVQRDGYFHVELMSIRRSATKLKYLAAAESAMDAFIADVIPESVAARLRELGP